MSEERKSFYCKVLTPLGQACSAETVSAVFPARDGLVGVWAGRSPLVALMGCGAMTLITVDGGRERFFISGGLARVDDKGLTILAEECISSDAIVAEEAWDEIQAARHMSMKTDDEAALRKESVEAASLKFKLAQEKREGRSWGPE